MYRDQVGGRGITVREMNPSTLIENHGKAKRKSKDSNEPRVTAKWDDKNKSPGCPFSSRRQNKTVASLNPVGYKNLERMGIHYTRSQLKYHWDNVRKD